MSDQSSRGKSASRGETASRGKRVRERARYVAWIGAILVLGLSARLAAGYWWQQRLPPEQQFAFGDSFSYWALAQTIYRGESYQYGSADARIFRTPGYPLFLAGLFRLAGTDNPSVLVARAGSAACGTVAVAAVIALGWRLYGPPVGLGAGLLAAVHPEAVSLGTFVLSEAPFHPLLVLNLLCLLEAWRAAGRGAERSNDTTDTTDTLHVARRLWPWALTAGALAGLATLMRPSWLLFSPYVLVFACVTADGRSRAWRLGTPLLLGLIVTMLPWWWRNYEVTGRFVPTSLQVGASLYDGWRPDARGDSDMRFVPRFVEEQRAADAAAEAASQARTMEVGSRASPPALPNTFEERLDRRQRDAALAWAREHPRRVLELAGIKFARMWSPFPNAAEMQGRLLRWGTIAGYVPLMALAIWQSLRRSEWRTGLWLLWMPALYFTNLHVIFVSSLRYRQPALLPLMVLAAAAVYAWVCRWRRSRASLPSASLPSASQPSASLTGKAEAPS